MKKLAWALALAACLAGNALAAVNINTATKEELDALPGIGPAKAQAIVDHRKQNGPFRTIDDLKNVKGIGAKRLEKMRADITVGTPAAPSRPAAPAATSGAAVAKSGTSPAARPEHRTGASSAKGELRAGEGKPAR